MRRCMRRNRFNVVGDKEPDGFAALPLLAAMSNGFAVNRQASSMERGMDSGASWASFSALSASVSGSGTAAGCCVALMIAFCPFWRR